MSKFSDSELERCQLMGGVVLAIAVLMAITAQICISKNVGTPEYMVCMRGSCWTVVLLGCVWLAIATFKRMDVG